MKIQSNIKILKMKKLLLMFCLFIGLAATGYSLGNSPDLPDPLKKAKGLQKELKLTDAQTTKIAAIYKESAEKFEKIKADEHGNTNKMLPAITPLRKSTIKKIKAVLTPDQAAKYEKLVNQTNKSVSNGGWSDGWSSASEEK